MKIAIIGAGASGLTAIKCCIDEGLKPVCFEKQGDIGGLWNFVPGHKEGATVYKSTVMNTSKEMMCFSDFPIPKEYPNLMHNTKVQEYFRLYAEKFKLMQHINFNTQVISCVQADGFTSNGQWKVTTRDTESNETKTGYYGGVLVCVGHHGIPHYPLHAFPGIEKFKGKYNHSHDYRDERGYEDLRVVVIGIGNSGGDIAVELSRHCKQVYLSTRRGSWVSKRIFKNGLPADYMIFRKVNVDIQKLMPSALANTFTVKSADSYVDHKIYGLKPKHGFFSQYPMLNDDLPSRIITGSIIVKGNVSRFTEKTAIFEDKTEEEIDAVIFATGYSVAYPFLDPDVIDVQENDADLYKYVFPISLARPTLAVVGCVQPRGAINPVSEMQCRWATRVIKRDVILPSKEEMKKDIDQKREAMKKTYVHSRRHTLQVDYVSYMDEVAGQIQCKPNILKLFLTDPVLAAKVYFGPAVPSMYRLVGPGKWSKARETLMSADERMMYPFSTRKVDVDVEGHSDVQKVIGAALVAIFLLWFLNLF